MRFKIDWASLIVGSKFTVFALFYFVFEGNFPSTSPRGAYIWRGDLTKGFLRYRFGGLIFGGAYTWRGLFSEFYGMLPQHPIRKLVLFCKMGYKYNSTLCDNGYNHLPISLEISLSSHHLISFICPVSFSGGAEGGCYSEILELLWEGRKF